MLYYLSNIRLLVQNKGYLLPLMGQYMLFLYYILLGQFNIIYILYYEFHNKSHVQNFIDYHLDSF
jgi:hypothetical protein